jgi:hypothetical protein
MVRRKTKMRKSLAILLATVGLLGLVIFLVVAGFLGPSDRVLSSPTASSSSVDQSRSPTAASLGKTSASRAHAAQMRPTLPEDGALVANRFDSILGRRCLLKTAFAPIGTFCCSKSPRRNSSQDNQTARQVEGCTVAADRSSEKLELPGRIVRVDACQATTAEVSLGAGK